MSYIIANAIPASKLHGDLATYGFDFNHYDLWHTVAPTATDSTRSVKTTDLAILQLNTLVALSRATSLDEELNYLQILMQQRQHGLDEMGVALADCYAAEVSLAKLTDTVNTTSNIRVTANKYLNNSKFNIPTSLIDNDTYTKGELQKVEQYFLTAMEQTDNDLSQDTIRLKSIFGKRDNAWDLASKLQQKFISASRHNITTIAQ